jgi:Kef-type K+ transport system membrane component KefB/nucleotide-binding universal stress UspA family protein
LRIGLNLKVKPGPQGRPSPRGGGQTRSQVGTPAVPTVAAYAILVGLPLAALLLILRAGAGFTPSLPPAASGAVATPAAHSFLLQLLLQVAVILVVARLVGALFRLLHQPQVVGEMVAGILLGPSLLGWLAPGVSAALFPPESLGYLDTLSQIGLVLFMFLVGLEFDPRLLRGRGRTAVITSHVSIVAPFMLGAALALYLYPRLAEGHVQFGSFALFMGAAMSITAFPVLARILTERNLLATNLGAVTIACAAIDDVTAWTILAVVIAIVRADAATTPLWITLAGSAAFAGAMVFGMRRLLRRLEPLYHTRGRLTQDLLAGTLLLLLASAWTTEWLGIHALFGAFLFGAVMPKDVGLVHDITERLEDVTVVFLLPLFFAFTGLRTSIGLVTGVEMWLFAALILVVAVAGKFGGSTLAARITGMPWRESAALGVLMNTRGLMELVILTIGLDLGVISPTLFTMMVFMALITTFMTTPLLELIYPARLIRRRTLAGPAGPTAFTTLIPVSLASSGPGLLFAARLIAPHERAHLVYALHLHAAADQSLTHASSRQRPGEERVLQPLLDAALALDVTVRSLSFVSRAPGSDIADVAEIKAADLVLMGSHKPVISRSVLGGTVNEVMNTASCDVAVYIERVPPPWRRILVPHSGGIHDDAALEVAQRIALNGTAQLTVLQVTEPGVSPAPLPALTVEPTVLGVRADYAVDAVTEEAARGYDLLVVGIARSWGLEPTLFGPREEQLAGVETASLIIIRKHITG